MCFARRLNILLLLCHTSNNNNCNAATATATTTLRRQQTHARTHAHLVAATKALEFWLFKPPISWLVSQASVFSLVLIFVMPVLLLSVLYIYSSAAQQQFSSFLQTRSEHTHTRTRTANLSAVFRPQRSHPWDPGSPGTGRSCLYGLAAGAGKSISRIGRSSPSKYPNLFPEYVSFFCVRR